MIDCSIIIISYNTNELLHKCLGSLYAHITSSPYSYEVLVVDNASSDGSPEMVKNNFPHVQVIINKQNVGFGRANNQAAGKAHGKLLFFLNSDTEVLDDAVNALCTFALKSSQNAIYGSKLLNPDNTDQASAGKFYTLPIVILSLFFKGDYLHLTRSSPSTATYTDWVSGACFLVPKDVFVQLGGFDEKIFMYMDEVDFCFRAKEKNIKTLFYPDARFIHIGSASSDDKRKPYVHVFEGLLYFYRKHWPKQIFLLKFILYAKSFLGITLGHLLFNNSLKKNYSIAWKIVATYE